MKKCIKWLLIALTIVIIVSFLGRALFFLQFSYVHRWAYCADYDHYADDFNCVKDYVQTQYPDEYDKYLSISYYGGIRLYDPDADAYLELPADIHAALEAIGRNGFPYKDANWDVIRIHGDRITFGIVNGQYALVYSPNSKPTWVNSPEETQRARVKTIGDGWYHVAK